MELAWNNRSELQGDLKEFELKYPNSPDISLAFIDGNHSFSAVQNDIKKVEKILLKEGWICFDDAFSVYDGVDKAIELEIIQSGKYKTFQRLTRKLFIAQRLSSGNS